MYTAGFSSLKYLFFSLSKLYFLAAIFLVGALFAPVLALAQNDQRLQEEDIKEQERISKYKEYLAEREAEEKAILEKPVTLEELETENLVEVEPNNVLPSDLVSTYALVPYKVRRPRWGHVFSATYGMYEPFNYKSEYDPLDQFSNTYASPSMPFLELSYEYKWNTVLGSFGGEVGYGFYTNDAEDPTLGDAELSLQVIRAGGKYIADNIFYEPVFAPYVMGGAYTVVYEETQGNVAKGGTTGVAYYYGVGIMLQMGWLDPSAAVDAYIESGIENTFLFLEARQYLASSKVDDSGADPNADPDFSTDPNFHVGVSLEF